MRLTLGSITPHIHLCAIPLPAYGSLFVPTTMTRFPYTHHTYCRLLLPLPLHTRPPPPPPHGHPTAACPTPTPHAPTCHFRLPTRCRCAQGLLTCLQNMRRGRQRRVRWQQRPHPPAPPHSLLLGTGRPQFAGNLPGTHRIRMAAHASAATKRLRRASSYAATPHTTRTVQRGASRLFGSLMPSVAQLSTVLPCSY